MQKEHTCPYGYTFGVDYGKGGNLVTNIGELPDTSVCDIGCEYHIWEQCKQFNSRKQHDISRIS